MRNLKKLVALLVFGTTLASAQIVALAATSTFNITVGAGEEDPMSKRTLKAGTPSYENRFYVTVTSMTPSDGAVGVESNILNGPLGSEEIIVYSGTQGASGAYNGTAPYDVYYYMKGRYAGSSIAPQINMGGRYTP